MHTYRYTHMYRHTHTHMCTLTHTQMHAHTHTRTYTHTHVYTHTHTHRHIHTPVTLPLLVAAAVPSQHPQAQQRRAWGSLASRGQTAHPVSLSAPPPRPRAPNPRILARRRSLLARGPRGIPQRRSRGWSTHTPSEPPPAWRQGPGRPVWTPDTGQCFPRI